MLFIYKALLLKPPSYLTPLLSFKPGSYRTRSSNYLTLDIPYTRTNIGRTGFNYYAPLKWNELQTALKLELFFHLGDFKYLLSDVYNSRCNRFNWFFFCLFVCMLCCVLIVNVPCSQASLV